MSDEGRVKPLAQLVSRPSSRPSLTHSLRLRCPLRPVIPILRTGDVRQAPLVPVPAVEPVHLERPEPGHEIADDDEAVRVPHLDAPGTAEDSTTANPFPVG